MLVAGRDLDGQEILSAHARLPSLGWSVITELPRAEVLAPVYASIRLSLVALLGGLVASRSPAWLWASLASRSSIGLTISRS